MRRRRGLGYDACVPGVTARCANHATREAMGICVRCGTLVCAECVTQVDGVNHCVACLAAAGAARTSVPPTAPRAPEATRSGWISLVLTAGLLALALWGVLEATLPG